MAAEKLISHKLEQFARKNNWLISGEYIYGEEQGFLFTGMDAKHMKTFITPVPGITQDQIDDLFALLEKNKPSMKLDEYEVTDDFLCIRLKNSLALKPDDIDFSLALLTGSMKQVNIVSEDRCQVCKELGAEATGFVYDLYCSMHEKCSEIQKQEETGATDPDGETSDESEDTPEPISDDLQPISSSENISELKAVSTRVRILFTLFGALLGSIPWLILPFVVDLINDYAAKISAPVLLTNFVQSLLTCLCAYLISSFAVTGYNMSKAPVDSLGRKVIGFTASLVVVLTQFAYLAVLIIKEPNVRLNAQNYLANLVKFHFYITMLLGTLIGLVFVFIAVLPFFDKKDREKKIIPASADIPADPIVDTKTDDSADSKEDPDNDS